MQQADLVLLVVAIPAVNPGGCGDAIAFGHVRGCLVMRSNYRDGSQKLTFPPDSMSSRDCCVVSEAHILEPAAKVSVCAPLTVGRSPELPPRFVALLESARQVLRARVAGGQDTTGIVTQLGHAQRII